MTVNQIVDAVNHVIEAAKTRKTVTMIEIVKTKEGNVSTIQISAQVVAINLASLKFKFCEISSHNVLFCLEYHSCGVTLLIPRRGNHNYYQSNI